MSMKGDKHWSAVVYAAVPMLSSGRDFLMGKRHLVRKDELDSGAEYLDTPCGMKIKPYRHALTPLGMKEHPVCRRCLDYTDKLGKRDVM